MKRSTKQVLSALLVIVMMLGLLVVPTVAAGSVTHTLDVSKLTTGEYGTKDSPLALTNDTLKKDAGNDDYFKATGTVAYKVGDSGAVSDYEVAKAGASALTFTVTGTADVTVKIRSGGSGKLSALALKKGTDVIAPTTVDSNAQKVGDYAIVENTVATVTYTGLTAGTYSVQSATQQVELTGTVCGIDIATATADNVNTVKRGVRVKLLQVVETPATTEEPSTEPSAPTAKEYTITVDADATKGTVTASAAKATEGTKITLTVTPKTGFELDAITVNGAAITGTEFEMPGKDTEVKVTFKTTGTTEPVDPSEPPAGKNEWVAAADNVPGGTPDLTPEALGGVVDKETLVAELDGLKFYVGGGSKAAGNTKDSKYKFKDSCLMGDADAESAVGTKLSTSRGYEKPVAGTYFKFVATQAGVLTVTGDYNAVPEGKAYYVAINDAVQTDVVLNSDTANKALEKVTTLSVKANDEVIIVGAGTKPMLRKVEFKAVETVTSKWEAAADNVPGGTPDLTPEALGGVVEKELLVADLDGVKFYVGGGSKAAGNTKDSKYKFKDSCLMGDADAESAVGTKLSTSRGYEKPVAGTYFKWVVSKAGVLTVTGDYNAVPEGKAYYLAINDTVQTDVVLNSDTANKALEKVTTLSVKAGDEIIIVGAGTKPMLRSFEFTGGGVDEVTADWTAASIFANPAMTAQDDGKGAIVVSVTGVKVGKVMEGTAMVTYADNVTVSMMDKDGKVVSTARSEAAGSTHSIKFTPAASGEYTFKLAAMRKDQADLTSDATATATFKLPLGKPVIKNATSAGDGKVSVAWIAVPEVESYNVYMDAATTPVNTAPIAATATSYTVTGLEIGSKHTFKVEAVQGATKMMSDPSAETEVTQDARRAWNFVSYGPSTTGDRNVNGYKGGVNKGETLELYSLEGSGKLLKGADGLCFYYTEVPADENFTLKAKIHVDYWNYSNGQEGFGLMAADIMTGAEATTGTGVGGTDKNYWTNNHMLAISRTESDSDKFSPAGRLGIMLHSETGITTPPRENGGTEMSKYNTNLDARAVGEKMTGIKEYNIVGNMGVKKADGTSYESAKFPPGDMGSVVDFEKYTNGRHKLLTDFVVELKRNNTGYYATWYKEDGTTVIKTAARPHPHLGMENEYDALLVQDPTTVNVGFIAARHAYVTITDVEFNTINKADDAPAEIPETKIVKPSIKVASSTNANSEDYNLILTSDIKGTAEVTLNGQKVETAEPIFLDIQGKGDPKIYHDTLYGKRRADVPLKLKTGNNTLEVKFVPAPNDQQVYEYEWSKLDENIPFVETSATINYDTKRADRVNIYVSPNGSSTGTGSKERPMTLSAAVKLAHPGQKIVLMEGTYRLITTVEIPKGISGKPGEMIYLIADPEATSRPVLDFQDRARIGLKVNGDYWYLEGFDVTRSMDRTVGINVGGSNNTLVDLRTYYNGNSGLQIARDGDTDGSMASWPSNNLILNCMSYLNADAGREDADGFAAKLTCGPGNTFRGCVAAYNADDGWDLYAKMTGGPIGQVTIENCVAFKNGLLLLDEDRNFDPNGKEVVAGNGNGFKMGGEGMGDHILRNSYSFWNKGKGLDCNSGAEDEFYNSVSYSNGTHNVALYTTNGADTFFKAKGIISFKDDTTPILDDNASLTADENIKPKNQNEADYKNDTTYYWMGGKTVNASGKTVDAASLFKSLEFKGVTYDAATRTYSIGDFLKLKDDADKTVGEGVVPNDNPEAPVIPGGKPDTTVDPTLDPADPAKKPGGSRDERGGTTGGDQPSTGLPFVDVKAEDWFFNSVQKAYEKSLMKGVDAERFAPNSNTTRAMVATVLYRLDGEKKTDVASLFTDVDAGTWFTDAVAWAAEKGIVKGYSDTSFGPNDNVTREQLAAMLYRYAAPEAKSEKDLSTFSDAASVSDWALEAITWAVDKGIMNGKGDGRLDPQGLATRAEVCTMLVRFLEMK